MKILNLTQHPASADQKEAGVFNLEGGRLIELKELLTFDTLPTAGEIEARAKIVAKIAKTVTCDAVMIGGAPFFMSALEKAIDVKVLYAFSQRVSEEKILDNGDIVKTNIFKHIGFIEVK